MFPLRNLSCGGARGSDMAIQAEGNTAILKMTQSFRPQYGPRFDSASNRNEHHEYFLVDKDGRCVELTTLPPPYADCHEI